MSDVTLEVSRTELAAMANGVFSDALQEKAKKKFKKMENQFMIDDLESAIDHLGTLPGCENDRIARKAQEVLDLAEELLGEMRQEFDAEEEDEDD